MMLATDEYLHGIISMVNELPRLAVNAVTVGTPLLAVRARPLTFRGLCGAAAHLDFCQAAAQCLPGAQPEERRAAQALRRYEGTSAAAAAPTDCAQYDVKRIEEIIYDISLRGLAPRSADAGHSAPCSTEQANEVLARLCGAS